MSAFVAFFVRAPRVMAESMLRERLHSFMASYPDAVEKIASVLPPESSAAFQSFVMAAREWK